MIICKIHSIALEKMRGDIIVEDGFFELEVDVDLAEATATGDPKGFINKTIVEHLMQCKIVTGVPLYEGLWAVSFTQFAIHQLEYPEGFVI